MKTKFKIPNKILSLLLSLVVMVGMIPMMSMTVHAALSYKSSIPKENRVYTVNLNNFVISEEESLSNVKSCIVYSYSRSGSKVTLEIYVVYLMTSKNRTDSFSANLSFDDGECTTELAEITRTLYHPKTSAIYGTFSIKRNAIAHTGTATCTTPATCTRCGVSFGTTNNSHNWGDWISNKNGTHTRTCTYNSDHKENGNCSHSAATCLAASVCPVCNHTYVAQLSHNYTYTATDNTVIEACPNGCKHSKTATLNADAEYTYTGSSITPATINFPDGWVGNTVENTAISYENNLNVGTATASVNIEGKTATKTFEIKAADIGDATVTLNPESSTYSGK